MDQMEKYKSLKKRKRIMGENYTQMDLMPSEPMQLALESSHLTVDLNADKNPFQLTYANQVKKCGEMACKLHYLREQMLNADISPPPKSFTRSETNVEVKLGEIDDELTELNSNIEKLQQAYNELIEYKIVLQKKSNSINTLPDELLLEILFRLPCSKYAIRCKSVCKRWACLISTPFFIACFTLDKKRKHIELFCTSIAYPCWNPGHAKKVNWSGLTMCLRNPFFKPKKLSFCSLPTFKDGNANAFTIHASCNDLFVYCKDELGKQDYYICNIRTHQWLLLPTFPVYYRTFRVAFSCDPYCNIYDHGDFKTVLNPAYRYSIVVLPYEPGKRSRMSAQLFSNTANEWNELLLLLPQPCKLVAKNSGFVFDGKLHFVCYEGIVGFDPYDDHKSSGVLKCHIIAWPDPMVHGEQRIGECQGKLRLIYHVDEKRLLVWCLKDYEKSEWSLQNSIEKDEWIIRNERVSNYLSKKDRKLRGVTWGKLLAIHPTNPDVVYALFPRWIVLCELSKRSVKIVARVDARGAGLSPRFIPFQSMLPSWPTPLPALQLPQTFYTT